MVLKSAKLGGNGPSKEVPCISLWFVRIQKSIDPIINELVRGDYSQSLEFSPVANEVGDFPWDWVPIYSPANKY